VLTGNSKEKPHSEAAAAVRGQRRPRIGDDDLDIPEQEEDLAQSSSTMPSTHLQFYGQSVLLRLLQVVFFIATAAALLTHMYLFCLVLRHGVPG
jgi:hypothetical protein